jgi:hypothetical protein
MKRYYGAGQADIQYKPERVDVNKALTVAQLYNESGIEPTIENVLHVKNLEHLGCFKETELVRLMNRLYKLYGKREVVADGFVVENIGSCLRVVRK